jgi:hypothetical protein
MGLSIVGGVDQACPPFGVEQRGVFVSKVREFRMIYFEKNELILNRFFQMVQHLERIFVLVTGY